MRGLRIGELAARAGVNLQTVYYYERRGLVPAPPRSAANHRLYSERDVLRVRFIQRARRLGFSLAEIGELLSLRARPGARCGEVLVRARSKLAQIDRRIAALRRMRRALGRLVQECEGSLPATDCPILAALQGAEQAL
ncbi:MAG: Hg(II)-responsive transcriptional regulator [Planctomycetota bacterium]|nr:MAG: Hg(II)-responsive transcriptional regulator [Planctomycetota bacterium]